MAFMPLSEFYENMSPVGLWSQLFFKERISQLLFSRGHLTATEQRLCGITISVISIAFVYKCTVISRKKIFSRTKKDPVSDFMYCLQT